MILEIAMFNSITYLLAKKRALIYKWKEKRKYKNSMRQLKTRYIQSLRDLDIFINDYSYEYKEKLKLKIGVESNKNPLCGTRILLELQEFDESSRIAKHNQLIEELIVHGQFLTEQYLRQSMPEFKPKQKRQ